jgi:hypothetical protein
VRVTPDAIDADAPVIPVRLGALEALRQIDEKLPEEFRERCREAIAANTAVPRTKSTHATNPDAIRSTRSSPELDRIKYGNVYAKAWKIQLPSGWVGWVEHLDVRRTYLGMMEGLPLPHVTAEEIEEARQFVRQHSYGPEPVLIPPKLLDADSEERILPPLRFAARISSREVVAPGSDGSWMNLVWFADIDDEKSIKDFVCEALMQVDWKTQAEGFEF